MLPERRDGFVAAALVLMVVASSDLWSSVMDGARRPDVWAWLWAAVAVGALAWWRVAPVAMLAAVAVGTGGYVLAGYAPGPVLLCPVFATFHVARVRSVRVSLAACAAAAAVVVTALLVRMAGEDQFSVIFAVAWLNWLVVPWSLGTLVQVRTVAARRVRAELVERGALEERMRVAREVHDVAGHGFSVIAMQAGVALLVLEDNPAQARASLEAIRTTSTGALGELRLTLGMLEAGPAEKKGLDALPELADRVRGAGLPVDLQLEQGDRAESPSAEADAAAYRVVQESLTNVLRHAGSARARVRVARQEGDLLVEVTDDGAGTAATKATGTETEQKAGATSRSGGRGLAGMRNRIEALGGKLTAGPRDGGGGFQVLARIPMTPVTPVTPVTTKGTDT